jgi:predicted nucleic acid-binding Zn ribbon protein
VVARLIAQAERLAAQVERVQRRHAELQVCERAGAVQGMRLGMGTVEVDVSPD